MKCKSSIETLMRAKAFTVRLVHCTNHVEMYGVSSHFESLPDIGQLNILQPGNQRIIALRVKEDGSTVLILRRCLWVSSEFDISCEKSNLCPHVNEVIAIPLDLGEVLELEWLIERDDGYVRITFINCCNSSLLSLSSIKTRRRDGDLLTGNPVNRLAHRNLGRARQHSLIQKRPSRHSLDTVHIEDTFFHSNTLVSENGQEWS